MTKTLIEALEELPRFKVDYEERGGEIYADTFPDENGDCILHSDLRAIIEQYKTEGAEPLGYVHESTIEASSKKRWTEITCKITRNKQAEYGFTVPLFYTHPSPAIVGELVKALEEATDLLGVLHAWYWGSAAEDNVYKDHPLFPRNQPFIGTDSTGNKRPLWDAVNALLARAKTMTE